MFSANVYTERRKRLKKNIGSGILLFLGNEESPINYPDNSYVFRQDSSFLYFWGLDLPELAAIIDIDEDRDILFGRELTIDEKVWIGPRPALNEYGLKSGVDDVVAFDRLQAELLQANQKGRDIHFLPQYRPQNLIRIQQLLGIDAALANASASEAFIKAVVAQRSIKTREEIEQIEAALDITCEMQILAMNMSKPGMYEKEVAGAMAGLSYSRGGAGLAFPIIFTVRGHIQHNPHHGNLMQAGDMIVNDCGAESAMHYASDITRTFPVSGKFDQRQREIYTIVFEAQKKAIEAIQPGVEYREVHLLACRHLTAGLKALGLVKDDVDAAVAAGAHALFMPGGLGHMLGLDVHDMEGLGEDYVGYTDEIQRSEQFGTCNLRLARVLESGFVITVEPGLYFIPELIDQWKAEKRFEEFINYNKVETYKNFGGIRIEDDVLVLEDGCRVLGNPIPKAIEDVE
ncbi:MAG: aminopeptidase P N-terminal domain-containing protein, partial [Deltaproteobacteria bacterium]|nr:aminopeptidase P N-terminal domain-containing protein [Deltaproteobacteria bacterium]